MSEMSPEDLEKLRRLEAEVDAERDAARKKREELAAKVAVVPVEEKPEAKLPVKTEEPSKELVTDKDAHAWKRGLQKKVAAGAAGVMLTYWLMSNILTIVAGTAVVAGAYYLSGRYLNPAPEDPAKKKKEDGGA